MWNKFQELFNKRYELGDSDKQVLESLQTERLTLESIEDLKKNAGWKIIEAKMKEELRKSIHEKVKDDVRINTLLEILNTVETKDSVKVLEEAIESIIG